MGDKENAQTAGRHGFGFGKLAEPFGRLALAGGAILLLWLVLLKLIYLPIVWPLLLLDLSLPFWPDVPLDAFGAFGLGDQIAMVLPGLDLVIVRVGPPSGSQGRQGVLANDLPALVVAATE